MASASIDALTSPTLKYLRERWWNDDFTEFLAETLRPRPGIRILDVGCGEGTAELRIGRLHVSQIRLVGVDLMIERVMVARHQTAAHNQRIGFATADACQLPFRDGVFDSTFCVAVLQHIGDVDAAVGEFARVTAAGLQPAAFEMSARFFAALAAARGDVTDAAVGPRLSALFARHGIEPLDVRLFPVSQTRLGVPPGDVWARRRDAVEQAIEQVPTDAVRALGREYLEVLTSYAAEATSAGSAFVEIQNTMLFATVGQKPG